MKPKILIVAEDGCANNTPHFMINRSYGQAVSKAGGLPLIALSPRLAEEYAQLADGLLLIDGPEIHRSRYGEIYQPTETFPPLQREREAMEWKLCQLFSESGKPILGIGRGMQMINVFFGGTLRRDLSAEHISMDGNKTCFTQHAVFACPESKWLEVGEFSVNSAHNQAIRELGNGIIASATARDGTVEACEHRDLPIFGAQWHPELLESGAPIFRRFICLSKEGAK